MTIRSMNQVIELSTEEKIKEVARRIFLERGFAGTKIRDIADEAGINIALLNYYFRSKEKLFFEILKEALVELLSGMFAIFDNKSLGFEEKIKQLVHNDIEVLRRNPLLATFVFSEIVHQNPQEIVKIFPKILEIEQMDIVKQYYKGIEDGKFRNIPHKNFFGCMQGMVIQPFLEKPIHALLHCANKSETEVQTMFEQHLEINKKVIVEMLLNYLIIK